MTETRRTTSAEAKRVGDEIGVDWNRFDLEQFRLGMDVEYEHGSHDPQTDVTGRWEAPSDREPHACSHAGLRLWSVSGSNR